jgi:mRNA interferase RelE/StbE
MKYRVLFAPEAKDDFYSLAAYQRAAVQSAINTYLLHEPTRLSKSRIKLLHDIKKPQYRLRVGDIRVFYDVHGTEIHVLAIVKKSNAAEWLKKWGEL